MRALELQGDSKAIRSHRGIAIGSSVGLVRKRNEDRCLVARASYANGSRVNFTVAVVCDGLGGMAQGREAAILAASAFTAQLFCSPAISGKERLSRAVAYANAEVYHRLRGDGGTTLSAVVSFQHAHAILCHVGDSRIYGVSSERTLEQLSRDDTINALLNRREGEADAPKDSRLLQFVGMGDEMEPQIVSIPTQFRSILLTSDGAHDVPHSILQRVVSSAGGASDLIRNLLTLSHMLGGRDNASAILIPIGSEAELYDETGENELLTIYPNETLRICIASADDWERSGRMRAMAPKYSPHEPSQRTEEAPHKENVVGNNPASMPAASKGKGRATKPRKANRRAVPPKAEAADRLPLEEPDNEVDVQFSSPAVRPNGDKQ